MMVAFFLLFPQSFLMVFCFPPTCGGCLVAGLRVEKGDDRDPSLLGVFFLIRVRRYCARLWLGGCEEERASLFGFEEEETTVVSVASRAWPLPQILMAVHFLHVLPNTYNT
ncbi:unnamed protein product [Ectocarpus sp. 8 AP-2014]